MLKPLPIANINELEVSRSIYRSHPNIVKTVNKYLLKLQSPVKKINKSNEIDKKLVWLIASLNRNFTYGHTEEYYFKHLSRAIPGGGGKSSSHAIENQYILPSIIKCQRSFQFYTKYLSPDRAIIITCSLTECEILIFKTRLIVGWRK